MSEATGNPREKINKEIIGKDNSSKDEKKKKKKSLKSSEAKSKDSSLKSSSLSEIQNGDLVPAENGTSEENDERSKDGVPKLENGINEVAKDQPEAVGSKNPESVGDAERNVIMLREMDFRKLAELKEAFHLFDINRDGYIDKEDLKFTFTSMGKPNVADESLDQMLAEMSSDEGVDFDSFVKLFGYKAVELDPEEELLAALAKWDYHGNGLISEEILKRDLQGWGDKFSASEAECALEEAPLYKKDGTRMIDYVKFCNNICGLRNVEKTRQIEKEAKNYEDELQSLVN